jgi:hypothetical protein
VLQLEVLQLVIKTEWPSGGTVGLGSLWFGECGRGRGGYLDELRPIGGRWGLRSSGPWGDAHRLPGLTGKNNRLRPGCGSQYLRLDFILKLSEGGDWVVSECGPRLRDGLSSGPHGHILFLTLLVVLLLEEGGGRASGEPGSWALSWSGDVGSPWDILGDVLLSAIGLNRLFLLFVWCVRVARVSGDVRKLPLVAIGVDVSVLPPNNTVGSSGLFFETSIGGFIPERERAVVVEFVVVSDRLDGWGLILDSFQFGLKAWLAICPSVCVLSRDENWPLIVILLCVVLYLLRCFLECLWANWAYTDPPATR